FEEGIETVRRLLEEDQVTLEGAFHRFPATRSLPRPTQQPRPPFWIAAITTEQSFVYAAKHGHSIMAIPLLGTRMRPLLDAYRAAWRDAGHAGSGRVMLAFHMFCHQDAKEALELARNPVNHELRSLATAASGSAGKSRTEYPGYQQKLETLERENF